jgi:hypothetical protein
MEKCQTAALSQSDNLGKQCSVPHVIEQLQLLDMHKFYSLF